VYAHAGRAGTSRALRGCDVIEVKPTPERPDTPASTRAGGDPPLYRGAVKIGEQRLIAPQRIRFGIADTV
jgi:hypothetical protein